MTTETTIENFDPGPSWDAGDQDRREAEERAEEMAERRAEAQAERMEASMKHRGVW